LTAQNLESNRRPEQANHGPNHPTDNRDESALKKSEFRQPCVIVNQQVLFFPLRRRFYLFWHAVIV